MNKPLNQPVAFRLHRRRPALRHDHAGELPAAASRCLLFRGQGTAFLLARRGCGTCRENELEPARRRRNIGALLRPLRGRSQALRRRLGDLSLRARADGADPQAVARRQSSSSRCATRCRCCRRFTRACWSPATRPFATSRTAWAKIGDRAQGKSVPKRGDRSALAALRLGRAAGRECRALHRRRSAASAATSSCSTISSSDPQGTYRELCRFLGIEPWQAPNFKPQRINKTIRIGWLQRLLQAPAQGGPHGACRREIPQAREEGRMHAKAGRSPTIFRVRKRLLEWNKVPAKRQPLDPGVRQQIIDRLRDDVILLSHVDRPRPQPLAGRRTGGQAAQRAVGAPRRAAAANCRRSCRSDSPRSIAWA